MVSIEKFAIFAKSKGIFKTYCTLEGIVGLLRLPG